MFIIYSPIFMLPFVYNYCLLLYFIVVIDHSVAEMIKEMCIK